MPRGIKSRPDGGSCAIRDQHVVHVSWVVSVDPLLHDAPVVVSPMQKRLVVEVAWAVKWLAVVLLVFILTTAGARFPLSTRPRDSRVGQGLALRTSV